MFKSQVMHPLNATVSAILLGLTLLSMVGTVQAKILEIDFSKSGLFSGTAPSLPVNPATPFAKAFFNDHGGTGSVTLTMYVNNLLPGTAYVNDWYFNSSTAPLNHINYVSGDQALSVGNSTNAYKADGTGGDFDFDFHFPTANPGQIGQGLNSVYNLIDPGLTADSFNSLSVFDSNCECGGGYVGAIHVQGYGNSSWIAGTLVSPVPEPKTYAMLLAGLGLVGFSARRRKNFAA